MSGCVKTFKVKEGDEKKKINKLVSFRVDNEKLSKNIKLFGLN